MDPSLDSLMIYCGHTILWQKCWKHKHFFPEVPSWAPVSHGSNQQWIHKEVDCWFGSGSIGFMKREIHKFDSRPSILALEGNAMLPETKKHLSWNSWHWVQH